NDTAPPGRPRLDHPGGVVAVLRSQQKDAAVRAIKSPGCQKAPGLSFQKGGKRNQVAPLLSRKTMNNSFTAPHTEPLASPLVEAGATPVQAVNDPVISTRSALARQ
ncbi:hypothetical protein, partial [Nitrospirillum viridazoti]|uniref:hypothetical protein n=1 Tax=Nitrospirillum viridazoti TaxID=3144925 RepID=UPI0019D6EF8F